MQSSLEDLIDPKEWEQAMTMRLWKKRGRDQQRSPQCPKGRNLLHECLLINSPDQRAIVISYTLNLIFEEIVGCFICFDK